MLSGSDEDRPAVDTLKARLDPGVRAVDLCGRVDLVTLAAVLERRSLLITGDTGPMHLAAALDVPLVAVFGPSDPRRWGPASDRARVVRVDLAVQPVQPDPPAARAVPRARARLPGRHHRGPGLRGGGAPAGSVRRDGASATTTLIVNTGDGERRVALDAYLDAEAAERAERDANAWIKSLRHVAVDGRPLRDRFTFRGDSLWWFAELYLHKRRVVVDILRTIAALDALFVRERPLAIGVADGDPLAIHLARQCAAKRQLMWRGAPSPRRASWGRRLEPVLRGALYTASAAAERFKPGRRRAAADGSVAVAAFVHSAFWRPDTEDESYIGPCCARCRGSSEIGDLALVGLGPPTNFRSRTWSHRLPECFTPTVPRCPSTPSPATLRSGARAVGPGLAGAQREPATRCCDSDALRAACVFRGCDAWPLLRDEFTGITHLQFPWSARAMDEIGAALDALGPRVAITYAEAGGSGRALVLEARRRGIRVVGLQHGFIYRHWLNYLHEPDEMAPSRNNPADGGFPRPDLTLLYDQFAARHLIEAGHFPAEMPVGDGQPEARRVRRDGAVDGRRRPPGAARSRSGRSRTSNWRWSRRSTRRSHPVFGALVEAVAAMPDVQLVVKCHPAETAAPYERAAAGAANVRIAPASADLARLVAVGRACSITVNSTAAVEAMPLDVPALVVGLPNNLSPFVEAGAVAGAATRAEIGPMLRAVLYDKEFRDRLAEARRAFMARHQIAADGRAAIRAAESIVRLACGLTGLHFLGDQPCAH